jgi:predicted DNA-binding transcriptional regulator YafY
MNRIDRLFAITLLLQSKRRVRAQDLARRFEVSERTIYRDMLALSESGVPVVSLPGEGYELAEGFYLPPLLFTPQEARALFLGTQMLITHTTGRLPTDAESALAKIAGILPKDLRVDMGRLTQIIGFVAPAARFDLDEPKLATLQTAIQEQRVVWMRYHSFNKNEVTEREVEPHALSYYSGAWYLEGYCRLRRDVRGFRLDRMDGLQVLNDTFKPHPTSRLEAGTLTARIRFTPASARWVRERQHYAFVRETPDPDEGGVIMEYRVKTLDELKAWLLAWGAAAEPLEPPELRSLIRAEILQLAKFLT